MNPNTMELRKSTDAELAALMASGFIPVPGELQAEAEKQLGERSSVIVRSGPLAKWAKTQRKTRRKQAAASRRRNRR